MFKLYMYNSDEFIRICSRCSWSGHVDDLVGGHCPKCSAVTNTND